MNQNKIKNQDGLFPAEPTHDTIIAGRAAEIFGAPVGVDHIVHNAVLNEALRLVTAPIENVHARREEPVAAFVLGARLARGERFPD